MNVFTSEDPGNPMCKDVLIYGHEQKSYEERRAHKINQLQLSSQRMSFNQLREIMTNSSIVDPLQEVLWNGVSVKTFVSQAMIRLYIRDE